MGSIAEREGHHPDFHLTNYRHVQVVLYTHKVEGITESDLTLARRFNDEVVIDYSPQWLKSNPIANKV
jgi:4a-hydroxytetrahydrobiopterin dehydratase